jgi:hypothetical protein
MDWPRDKNRNENLPILPIGSTSSPIHDPQSRCRGSRLWRRLRRDRRSGRSGLSISTDQLPLYSFLRPSTLTARHVPFHPVECISAAQVPRKVRRAAAVAQRPCAAGRSFGGPRSSADQVPLECSAVDVIAAQVDAPVSFSWNISLTFELTIHVRRAHPTDDALAGADHIPGLRAYSFGDGKKRLVLLQFCNGRAMGVLARV